MEHEFEHLERFLVPGGLKATQFFRAHRESTVVTYEPLTERLAGRRPAPAEFWLNLTARRSLLVLRLDDVFPTEQLDGLNYMKIDVEGAEPQVLASASDAFKRFPPFSQIETGIAHTGLDLPG